VDGLLRRRETGAPGFVCAVRAEDGVEVELFWQEIKKEELRVKNENQPTPTSHAPLSSNS
jgi:hypothetical protein